MTKIEKVSRGGAYSFLLAATIALCAASAWAGWTVNDVQVKDTDWSQSSSWVDVANGNNITGILTNNYTGTITIGAAFAVGRGGSSSYGEYVQNCGTVNISSDFVIGHSDSSRGFALINGGAVNVGSGGNLRVGSYKTSTSNCLAIAEGASVTAGKNLWVGCPDQDSLTPTGVVLVDGGSLTVSGNMYMGRHFSNNTYQNKGKGVFQVNRGTATIKGNVYLSSNWKSGASYPQTSDIIVNAGSTMNVDGRIYFNERCSRQAITVNGGTLNAKGGLESHWTAANCYRSRNSSLTVNSGGVFATKGPLYFNTYISSGERITFDNGTLKVLASFSTHAYQSYESKDINRTIFTIGAGGMKIDTQGYTLTWNTAISSGSGKITKEGSGTLAFGWTCSATGGIDVKTGTLSVTGSNTYFNGPVTVKNGATIQNAIGNTTDKLGTSVTFEDGAKLAVPAADGVLSVIKAPAISIEGTTTVTFPDGFPGGRQTILTMTGSGSFTAEDAAKLTVPANAAGYVFYVSSDGKSIQIGPAAGRWTGAAGNLLIDDPGNWSDNAVPDGTSAFIAVDEATTLLCNGTFSPKSITFAADSKAITFNGEGSITGIEAITNLNASSTQTDHRFNIPVSGDTVDLNNRGVSCCLFWGGFTVANPVLSNSADIDNAHSLAGRWTITGASWSPGTYDTVRGDASITFEHELKNPGNFNIASGAVVTAATMKVTSSTYPAYSNSGRLVVNGICDISNTSADFSLAREESQNATVILGGLVFNTSRWAWLNAKTIVVGSEGIKFDNTNNNFLRFAGTPQLYARDGTLTLHAGKDDNQRYAINASNTLTINTTQFESSPEKPSIVYINGKIQYASGDNYSYSGGIAVKGIGKVVFDSVSTFSGGLTVGDTATVAINAGKQAGTGTITVNSGATLSLPQTGTVTLGGDLTLNAGAALAFKVSGESSRSVLARNSKTLTLPASGTVKVKLTADSLPKVGSSYTLTSGADLEKADESKFELADGVGGSLSVSGGELVYKAPAYFYIKISESDAGEFKINPAWFWAHGGLEFANTNTLAESVAQPAPNGYTYLQNYLLGYEPDDPASKLRIDGGRDGGASGKLFTLDCTFNVPNVEPESGEYVVKAKLLSSADGEDFSEVEGTEQNVSARGAEETVSFTFTPDFSGGGMFRFFA